MTYCVGLKLKAGLVLLSDTRTNAGVDNIARFRKMFLFEEPGERVLALMTAGNLGITQGVIWRLCWLGDGTTLMGLDSGGNGGILLFWKPDAEKDFFRFPLPNLARDMDLHPDGLQVATAHYDRHVRITRLAAKAAPA